MDWILITLEVEQSNYWQAIEQASGIRTEAIKEVLWIKPIHLHMAGQRTAIEIFKLETREDANQVIERGLYVEGKKAWGRKQVQEPRRCLKCQCFREHKAAECRSIHDICGQCGKHHRTSVCSKSDKDTYACLNCKSANNSKHIGHGVADRRCLIFLERLDKMNKMRSKNTVIYTAPHILIGL